MLVTKNYQDFQVLSETGSVVKTFSGFANRCLPGDTVSPTYDGIELLKRNQSTPLVGTIHIQSKYLFGHTSRNIPIYLFFPYNQSYPPMRVGCSAKDGKNKIGLVMFESWDNGEKYPRGILQQILGDAGDPVVEELALKYNYAPHWKKIAKLTAELPALHTYNRMGVPGFTFNIEPPGCKDIDDCISVQVDEVGATITISIADLTEIVPPGSDLDTLASKQGSTLYSSEGEAIAPMLPRLISENYASLVPGQERAGLSLMMKWTGESLVDFRFYQSRVTNEASYTYESIYENQEICHLLTEVASYLEGARCTDSHKWVEHMMIFYNKKVAELFLKENTGLLRKLETKSLQPLERKAAEYCLPSKDAVHTGIGNSHYTHATSPIRRYADMLAQRYLVSKLDRYSKTDFMYEVPNSKINFYTLNHTLKQSARFERDLCFLRAVSQSTTGVVKGVLLDWTLSSKGYKVWVEIPQWNQIITFHMKGVENEDELILISPDEQEEYRVKRDNPVQVKYYCDRGQPNWKKRMVFGVSA